MNDLICDREFGCLIDGVKRRIVVEWFRPVRDRGDWRCAWKIHRPVSDTLEGTTFGVDSAQALLLAMGAVRGVLEHDYPGVFWLEAGSDLALPAVDGR